jgi:hypothetical protein
MSQAFADGYMYKQAEGPLPAAKPPALPKFNPADSINKPMSPADQASRRAFSSRAGAAKPALPAQPSRGLVKSRPAVRGLESRAAQVASRGSRLARLRHALGITPWGVAAEAGIIGGLAYNDYLNESQDDFRREQDLKYERIRQLTGMPRTMGPQAGAQ